MFSSSRKLVLGIYSNLPKRVFTSIVRYNCIIMDGKIIAKDIVKELKLETIEWIDQGHRPPHLVALLVGNDPASSSYVRNKMKTAKEVGIMAKTIHYLEAISETDLLNEILALNTDNEVDGILVQLPLPEHLDERTICNAVSPMKDVDGFNIENVGRLSLNMKTFVPCTPLGVQELIKRYGIETISKNVVVCGRSKNVGMPIALLLHADGNGETGGMDATTTICHRHTPSSQLQLFTRTADIIISAAGIPGLIKGDMVKDGVCIIDVGISRVVNESTGKMALVGDVDFQSCKTVAGHITPVPGGVGPMTVAMLMKNTLIAAKGTYNNILRNGNHLFTNMSA